MILYVAWMFTQLPAWEYYDNTFVDQKRTIETITIIIQGQKLPSVQLGVLLGAREETCHDNHRKLMNMTFSDRRTNYTQHLRLLNLAVQV